MLSCSGLQSGSLSLSYLSLPGYCITFGCHVSFLLAVTFPKLVFDSLEGCWGSFCSFLWTSLYQNCLIPCSWCSWGCGFWWGRPQWQSNLFLTLYYLGDSSPSSLSLLTLIESLRCCGLVSMMCNCLFLFCAVIFGERLCTLSSKELCSTSLIPTFISYFLFTKSFISVNKDAQIIYFIL